VLDEVLGTGPNITLPAVIYTADIDNEVPTDNEGVTMDEPESPQDLSGKNDEIDTAKLDLHKTGEPYNGRYSMPKQFYSMPTFVCK